MPNSNNALAFAVDRARLQFVLRAQPASLASQSLLAIITVAVMWTSGSRVALLSWAGAFASVTSLRFVLWVLTRSPYFASQPIAFWRGFFVAGCALSGASWGVAGVIFESSQPLLATFIAIVIAGTAAGSITSLASDRLAAYALILPCLVPFILAHLVSGSSVDIAIGLTALLYLVTMGGSVNRLNAQLADMMKTRADLQTSQASVSALNQRMKLAANVAKVGIYEWDLVTQEVDWDAQVFEMWDLDPAEGPATLEKWRSRVHPQDLSKTQARFQEIFEKDDEFDLEFRVVSRRGVIRDIRSRGFLQRDEQRKPMKMVGLVMDVTELRRLDRMKQEFVSMVSHELRTPLTSIRGGLGLLAKLGDADPAKAKQLVDLANRNADRLAVLIDDILDMDKIESGKMNFEWASRELNELVSQAVATNTMYAERLGVALVFEPAATSIAVFVDANRLVQVLTNLLSNAAKFSPRGESVEVSTRIQGSLARVSVRDYGSGIPPEFQARIFGKFNQSDGSDVRGKTGSGLGLAISKAIVEAMKGTIGFTTTPGEGTTFYFDLPLRQDAAQGLETASTMVTIDLAADAKPSRQPAREQG